MTVQFLAAWNGYEQYQTATLLPAEETRLISAGVCRNFVAGMDGRSLAPVVQDPVSGVQYAGQGGVPGGANSSDGVVFCDWQAANGTLVVDGANTSAGATVGLDASVLCDGLPTCRVTLGGAGTLIWDFVFATPATLAQLLGLQIAIRVSTNNAAFVGVNPMQLWLFSDAGGSQQWRLSSSLDMTFAQPGVMTTMSFGPGASGDGWAFAQNGGALPTSTTDLDAVTVYKIRGVMAVPAGVAGAQVNFGKLVANARRKPVVSIVLDGQYASQHQYILPMLEAQGLRCSLALQGSLIGAGGRMTRPQLDRAYSVGHEHISWGFDPKTSGGYQNASDWPDAASITADANANYALLAGYGWTRGIGYAVHGGTTHPFSGAVAQARQQIVVAGHRAAGTKAIRSGQGLGGAGPLNRLQSMARLANVDPYSLQGALQWTNTDNAASLNAVTTRAKARGEWAIVTGHRSVVAAPAALEMLNSELLAWAQALGDEARAGRVLVLPFGEASRYYGLTA